MSYVYTFLIICSNRAPSIFRTNTKFTKGAYTASQDGIVSLQSKYNKLSLSSDTNLFSDNYLQTSFAGFLINSIVYPIVAFSFGLSTSFSSGQLIDTNIPYDIINIDSHSGWDKSRNIYNVQITGLYVTSFSMAVVVNYSSSVMLRVNQKTVAELHLGLYDNTENGIEILSKTVILKLKAMDNLAAVLDKNFGGIYSDFRCPTSMKGFLYKTYRTKPISWRVVKEGGKCTPGLLDPFKFDIVYVNEGSGWNNTSHRFTVPLSGVYYLQISAGMCDEKPTKMELMVNGSPVINVYRQFTTQKFWDTRSRAVILRLRQKDEMYIRLPSEYYLWSSPSGFTEFGGFCLYN